MSIMQWAVTKGTIGLMRDAESDGKIAGLAEMVDKFVVTFFPDNPVGVKNALVEHVLLPLAKILGQQSGGIK